LAEPAKPAIPPELSIEELFSSPSISQLRFSPDGRYIAALQPWERRMNLVVVDLTKMQKTQVTSMKDNNINSFFWASSSRVVCVMDEDGKERPALFAVNADGSKPEPLDSLRGFGFVARIHGDDERVIVQGYMDRRAKPDLYFFDLKKGKTKVNARNPGSFDSWIVDRAGVARLGVGFEQGVTTISYRDDTKSEWQKIATFRDGEPSWEPIAFDGDNRTLYVACDFGRRTKAVFRYDTKTRQLGEMVHGDDTYDVTGVIYNDGLNRVIGVTYEADRPTVVWTDKQFADYQRALDRAFPETLVRIAEASADNSRLLAISYSDRLSGEYYLFDTAKRTLEPLASVRPNLKPAQLAQMHPFSFKARDDKRLYGYLTLPVGREPKNLPTIVHPHGGPYGPRDTWGFNPEVQFYANRGFAVLQVNFRGSGGYGDFYERAGYQKWGLEMQDDITDALKWAIAQGIVDPKKVVISGASYGGYATMAGLVYTPELYCAGINYVGVTDIMMLVDNPGFGSYDGRNGEWWRRTRLGDPYKDGERLKATSPANFADRIKVPLLMGYGLNDPRVEIAHGTKVVNKLESAGRVKGRDFWFTVESREGHGFAKEENRIAFYRQVDQFLKTQVWSLGTSAEVILGEPKVIEMPAKPKAD
jgi:dipeptidyl aminopeptidase/acylaminoacyl peptidase